MADGAFAEEIKEAGRRRKLKDTRVPAELLIQDGTRRLYDTMMEQRCRRQRLPTAGWIMDGS